MRSTAEFSLVAGAISLKVNLQLNGNFDELLESERGLH